MVACDQRKTSKIQAGLCSIMFVLAGPIPDSFYHLCFEKLVLLGSNFCSTNFNLVPRASHFLKEIGPGNKFGQPVHDSNYVPTTQHA